MDLLRRASSGPVRIRGTVVSRSTVGIGSNRGCLSAHRREPGHELHSSCERRTDVQAESLAHHSAAPNAAKSLSSQAPNIGSSPLLVGSHPVPCKTHWGSPYACSDLGFRQFYCKYFNRGPRGTIPREGGQRFSHLLSWQPGRSALNCAFHSNYECERSPSFSASRAGFQERHCIATFPPSAGLRRRKQGSAQLYVHPKPGDGQETTTSLHGSCFRSRLGLSKSSKSRQPLHDERHPLFRIRAFSLAIAAVCFVPLIIDEDTPIGFDGGGELLSCNSESLVGTSSGANNTVAINDENEPGETNSSSGRLFEIAVLQRRLRSFQQRLTRYTSQLLLVGCGGYSGSEYTDAHYLWGAVWQRFLFLWAASRNASEVANFAVMKECNANKKTIPSAADAGLSQSEDALQEQNIERDATANAAAKESTEPRDISTNQEIFAGHASKTTVRTSYAQKAIHVAAEAAHCGVVPPSQWTKEPELLEKNTNCRQAGDEAGFSLGGIASWFRPLGFFFGMAASVCQRLLYVVPLAFSAAVAAFWLLLLPIVSSALHFCGLESEKVVHWESVAQRELEEVIFTAVTAAASAAGPTYVKFLQARAVHVSCCIVSFPLPLICLLFLIIESRTGVVGVEGLGWLQTAVQPFAYPRAALLLREQFGEDVEEHLVLDPTPIGCGCIAQVYRAYLLLSAGASDQSKRFFLDHAFVLGGSTLKSVDSKPEEGGKLPPVAVAVKIMRPGVREAMEFDLYIMLMLASALQWLPAFDFVAIKNSVEEFATAMRRQLDFGLEEHHLKRFRNSFGLPSLSIPDDVVPIRNKCRRMREPTHEATPAVDPQTKGQHNSFIGSLSRKILGMRRQVTFPYPFESLSSSEVLVMTLEPGFTLNELLKTRVKLKGTKQGQPKTNMAKSQWDALISNTPTGGGTQDAGGSLNSAAKRIIEMVFLDNFFHGDMHSGNLLCRFARSSKERRSSYYLMPVSFKGPLELVVLDCGLAASLKQADRVNFVTLLEAVRRKHGRDADQVHVNNNEIYMTALVNEDSHLRVFVKPSTGVAMLQRARKNACKDKEGFFSEVEALINEYHFEEGKSMQMSHVRFTSLMSRMLALSKKYSVELDPSFVSIVVAMSVLEGVGAQLCPDADVLRTALPYSCMASKLLGCASEA
ncbi:hypothetical protein cyc_06767 [Cyclospora cayetanensis]|uniref:ABC1 atypical kinase-like domain-containing protein n=1 Tax=Cyclospora cayetanensis TaxID=88456 RepID=A0A1D3CUG1_9EIME|nr:hypothetical protein cyc_06767 [Cyclospora cayetanensis]